MSEPPVDDMDFVGAVGRWNRGHIRGGFWVVGVLYAPWLRWWVRRGMMLVARKVW